MADQASSALNQVKPATLDHPLPGARLALVLLLTINLFNYIDRQVLAAVVPDIRNDFFGADAPNARTLLGLLASAFLVSYMVFAPIFGLLAERMSRWLLVGVGVGLWSLASGASGIAGKVLVPGFRDDWHLLGWVLPGGFVILLLTRCLVGVGEGAYGPVAPTMISDLYPIKIRGTKLAWFYLAFPVGSALGYGLGGLMSDSTLGWRWAFYLVVPPGILLGLWCFLMPEPPRGRADAVEVTSLRGPRLSNYLILVRTPSYVLNSIGMTAMAFALGGIGFWMPDYIKDQRQVHDLWGIEARTAFGGITIFAGLTATLLGGLAGDKLRPRFPGSYFLVSGVAMLAAFPFVLLTLYTPFPLAWIFVLLAEFCMFFNTGPTNTALANVTHPAMRASAFAVNIFIIHAFGDVISPPIIGAVADRFNGDLNPGFVVVSASVLVGGAMWLWGARYLERDTELAPTRLKAE